MNDSLNFDFETIDILTRKQAIENGLQVCISDLFPSVKQFFSIPVYFTSSVWQICHYHSFTEDIVLDICNNTFLSAQQNPDASLIAFDISVVDSSQAFNTFTIWGSIGANDLDDTQPAITLMFPEEH